MKFRLHLWLLAIATLLFGGGLLGESEEIIVLSLVVGGASILTYIATLRALTGKESSSGVEERLQALERRLGITEGELDVANEQLRALRAERDFDRALAAGQGTGGEAGSLLGQA